MTRGLFNNIEVAVKCNGKEMKIVPMGPVDTVLHYRLKISAICILSTMSETKTIETKVLQHAIPSLRRRLLSNGQVLNDTCVVRKVGEKLGNIAAEG